MIDHLTPPVAQLLTAAALGHGPVLEAEERRRAAEDCVQNIEARTARVQRQALASALRQAEKSGDDRWRDAAVDLNSELRRTKGGGG